MKIRTGVTFISKENNNNNKPADGNETTLSESAEPSICGSVSARRSALLSCPFSQYSRTPRLAKPVSIPVVPGMKSKKDETVDSIMSASLSTSSVSLGPPSQISCSAIYQADNNRLSAGSCGSVALTPSMERRIVFTTEDQKDCGYESIYATPTRFMPRRRNRIRKPTTPPPPPPTLPTPTPSLSHPHLFSELDLSEDQVTRYSVSSQHINKLKGHAASIKPAANFDFLYDW